MTQSYTIPQTQASSAMPLGCDSLDKTTVLVLWINVQSKSAKLPAHKSDAPPQRASKPAAQLACRCH